MDTAFLYISVIAIWVCAAVHIHQSDKDHMAVCELSNSFETCFKALN